MRVFCSIEVKEKLSRPFRGREAGLRREGHALGVGLERIGGRAEEKLLSTSRDAEATSRKTSTGVNEMFEETLTWQMRKRTN